jgi:hypothetical protein
MMLGGALEALPVRLRSAAGGAILAFQLVALQHNLRIWNGVAEEARRTCRAAAFGALVDRLPRAVNGVPFLGNGF